MTWVVSHALMQAYENSLSSRGPVEASSEDISSDGGRCAQSSTTPTPSLYSSDARMMAAFRRFRSMGTCESLTGDRGEAVLTWCQEASRARTLVPQAREQGSQGSDQGSGRRCPESLAKYDPASRSWRTPQYSLLEDSIEYSGTFPRWGMTRGGELFRLPTPEHLTGGRGSGCWPTPTTKDDMAYGRGTLKLGGYVLQVPTPRATDGTKGGPNQRGSKGDLMLPSYVAVTAGGKLSPDWVELLMGWPKGWTSLESMVDLSSWRSEYPWGEGWEDGTPRVTQGTSQRAARLRCIGNGQVPQSMRLAWEILSQGNTA